MSRPAADEDEVEQLLRAAQDDVLLKLSLDSHTTRAAAYSINPDLDRRYEALKAQLNPKSSVPVTATAAATSESGIDGSEDVDDLFDRFAALKKSIPSHNNDEKQSNSKEESDGEDDDEVEKVIKWAVDAARLDPSGTTSDDETDDEVEFDKKKGEKNKGQNNTQ